MTRPLETNGDIALRLLEEIKACSQEIDNLIAETAASGTTNQAELSNVIKKINRLNKRIGPAADKAEKIRRQGSKRAMAAQEREARKRQSE